MSKWDALKQWKQREIFAGSNDWDSSRFFLFGCSNFLVPFVRSTNQNVLEPSTLHTNPTPTKKTGSPHSSARIFFSVPDSNYYTANCVGSRQCEANCAVCLVLTVFVRSWSQNYSFHGNALFQNCFIAFCRIQWQARRKSQHWVGVRSPLRLSWTSWGVRGSIEGRAVYLLTQSDKTTRRCRHVNVNVIVAAHFLLGKYGIIFW